jgi:hypothetical protein
VGLLLVQSALAWSGFIPCFFRIEGEEFSGGPAIRLISAVDALLPKKQVPKVAAIMIATIFMRHLLPFQVRLLTLAQYVIAFSDESARGG